MLGQRRRWPNIKATLIQRIAFAGNEPSIPNTILSPNAGLMLGQCRRLWFNIQPALGQCILFAGKTVSPFSAQSDPLLSNVFVK